MVGKYFIEVHNNKVSFYIEVKRSVTIIRGNSGSGKTTFIDLVDAALRDDITGVTLRTNYDKGKIEVIHNLKQIDYAIKIGDRDKIYILDENINLERYQYFVEFLQLSGSYLIYITRKNKTGILQYSVDEIYRFESTTKNNFTTTKMHPKHQDNQEIVKPDVIVTEDSNSGFDIIKHLVNIPVETSNGKDNIADIIKKLKEQGYNNIYAVVDCAAFGNCIEKVLSLGDIYIFRTESFE